MTVWQSEGFLRKVNRQWREKVNYCWLYKTSKQGVKIAIHANFCRMNTLDTYTHEPSVHQDINTDTLFFMKDRNTDTFQVKMKNEQQL